MTEKLKSKRIECAECGSWCELYFETIGHWRTYPPGWYVFQRKFGDLFCCSAECVEKAQARHKCRRVLG
jgi:hypothetical protein